MSITHMPKVFPGFKREKPKKVIPWKQIFLFIFFIIILGGLIYLLFFSPIFKIKDIELSAATQVNREEVLSMIKNDAVGKNIFFWDKNNVEREINNYHPLALNLLIYKGLPNTIKIVIQETVPKIAWETGGKVYLVDDTGRVIKEGVNEKLIKVIDMKNLVINPGEKILPSFFINFLDEFSLGAKKIKLKIKNYEVNESLFDLSAVTDKNISLILSPNRSAQEALSQYQKTIEKLGQPKSYMDLRFAHRVFVK